MAPPRITRRRKRPAEEAPEPVPEANQKMKRFRGHIAAGATKDIHLNPEVQVKSDPDGREYLKEVVTSKKFLPDIKIKVEVGGVGSNSEPESTNPVLNSTEKQRRVEELTNLVFCSVEEDMVKVRQIIIGHVIDGVRKGSPRWRDLRILKSVRLVSKSWLQDASEILLRCGQPLYRIHLTKHNSLDASRRVQRDGGKLLDQFTSAWISSTQLEAQVPPISLKIDPEFFCEENHRSFSNFLIGCAPGLVDLEMLIPEDGGSMPFLFGAILAFPHLRKLVVRFSSHRLLANEEVSSPSWVALYFIQFILNGTAKLKMLKFTTPLFMKEGNIPHGIGYLSPPSTITSLDVSSFVKSSELEALLNYHLPNLQILKFKIYNETYAEGLVTRILEKFRTSLLQLKIIHSYSSRQISDDWMPPTLFRFPLMEKLEECKFGSKYAELEKEHPPLDHLLPNLRTLKLRNQTVSQVNKWTDSSRFSNVSELFLWMDEREKRLPSFSSAFSNVRDLTLRFGMSIETVDLKQIFLEMTQLKKLALVMGDWFCSEDETVPGTGNEWDSLFTGFPGKLVHGLRESPEFMEDIQLRNLRLPSIVNLTKLEQLELSSPRIKAGGSLISDLTFHFALLNMPKLKMLMFWGGFKASGEMTRVWRKQGGILLSF